MNQIVRSWPHTILTRIALMIVPLLGSTSFDQGAAAQDSAMVRLLKSGRVKEEQQDTLVEMIGKRGSAADLGYLLEQATSPDGFSAAIREKALQALAEATATRKVTPEGDLSVIAGMIRGESAPDAPTARLQAIRLAGLWKVAPALEDLNAIAADAEAPRDLRDAAMRSLAQIGGQASRSAIEELTAPERPIDTRLLAVAALVAIDVDAAAEKAVAVLDGEVSDVETIAPMMDAFLDRQVGPDRLAAEIREQGLSTDSAKLALRYMYSIGRTDAGLVAALSEAAGINAEPEPLTEAEMRQLIADVQEHGDPERGEAIFRRADLNCMKCHAVSKAGGDVGPDLSAIGSSSPVDYLIRSIMQPEESVKEEFQVKTVLTVDGQVFQGIVKDESADRIVLRQATGEDKVIPTDDIDAEKTGGSLMPKGLTNFMTREELVDLLSFLSQLGKPGPYAIRPTPTIQRWRVLPLSVAGNEVDPDDAGGGDLPAVIASADPSRWQPAYAKVAGTLPLDELTESTEAGTLALRGEIEVTEGGPIRFSINSTEGLDIWVDQQPIEPSETFTVDLAPGRHSLTLRVETEARDADGIRVEVSRAEGSSAEFTVVGGP